MDNQEITKLQVTWGCTLRIWGSFIWRYTLCTFIFEVILIFLTTFSLRAIGRTDLGQAVYIPIGIIAAIPFSIIVLNKILQMQFREFSICLVPNVHKMEEATVNKKPKISLKTGELAMSIFLFFYSCGYVFYFLTPSETFNIIWGTTGFLYFYSLYTVATHLYVDGVTKMKPSSIFWLAFFSSAIPLVHLIVPIYLLKKSIGLNG